MSSSAALAAAKKRRNVSFGQDSANTSNTIKEEQKLKQPVTHIDLLKQHDYKIYQITNQLEKLEEMSARKDDLGLQSTIVSHVDNDISNKVETNNSEITILKATVGKLTKTINDTNSLVTTLRASLLSQTNALNQLKKEMHEFIKEQKVINENQPDISDKSMVTDDNVAKNIVKLEIKENEKNDETEETETEENTKE